MYNYFVFYANKDLLYYYVIMVKIYVIQSQLPPLAKTAVRK